MRFWEKGAMAANERRHLMPSGYTNLRLSFHTSVRLEEIFGGEVITSPEESEGNANTESTHF